MSRPGTGQRPPGTGMRPGSGRVGTARLGTGRLATGQAPPTFSGVGLATDVQVAERPVTQQGMAGMRTGLKSAGPGRQVQDLSYYMGLLRTRISDISAELNKITAEIEQRRKDGQTHAQLERRYDALLQEVRSLEGDLADYNLAMDKSRASTHPSEIVEYYEALRSRNQEEARRVDEVFLERQERERGIQRLEQQIRELQEHSAERLHMLPQQQQHEYQKLTEANEQMGLQVAAMQSDLEQLNAQVEEAESHLQQDSYRDEYSALERRMAHLQEERQGLDEEMQATRLDPTEARNRLLEKVRRHTERIKELDEEAGGLQQTVEQKRKTASELATDLEERRNGAEDASKYEVLYKRDQEMTEFIDRFDEMKEKEEGEQNRSQDTIVALLEHISSGLSREHSMPTQEEAGNMARDVGDKQQELGASKTTQERLQEEWAKRQAELAKVETLDEKIDVELSSLREKIESMREEMVTLGDLDGLRSRSEAVAEMLDSKRDEYVRRRDSFRPLLSDLSARYSEVQARLERHSAARDLEQQERRMRQYEQNIFQMREFVESRAQETQYEALREEVLGQMQTLNEMIQSAEMAMPSARGMGM